MESRVDSEIAQLRWHLVFTKAGSERVAREHLERQGYRVYFPRVLRRVLRRGAWRETIGALFPRYLFVQLNAALQSIAPMCSTQGVTGVVRFGTEYVPVPDLIVDGLIDREESDGLHRLNTPSALGAGSQIRVVRGALSGIDGIFEREVSHDRVVVLLNLLGGQSRIRLPAASIAPNEYSE